MCDHEHGHALLGQLPHDGEDFAGQLRVQRRGRLVEVDDLRVGGKGAGDGDALLLAARKLAGVVVRPVGQTDLSGLSACKGLKMLSIGNARPETLAPLEELQALQTLTLSNCGTLDLTPLVKLPALTSVSLSVDTLDSLEPLAQMDQLSYLGLTGGTTYPSLEPLVQTNVRYLNLGVGLDDSKRYEELDYTPLTEMKSLVWLDLTHHTRVDEALCGAILDSNKELKYLDISYTEAAKSGAKPKVEYLMDKT